MNAYIIQKSGRRTRLGAEIPMSRIIRALDLLGILANFSRRGKRRKEKRSSEKLFRVSARTTVIIYTHGCKVESKRRVKGNLARRYPGQTTTYIG